MWWLWLAAQGRRSAWVGLLVLNTFLVHTHFLGWAVVGLQVVLTLLLPSFRAARRPFGMALLGTAVLFIPYGSIFAQRVGSTVAQGSWLTAPTPEELYNMIWRWSNAPVLAVLFLAVIAFWAIRDKFRSPGMQLGLVWSFVPLIALFTASFITPVFLDRYLAFAAPGFALLTALVLTGLLKGSRFAPVPMVLACLGMAATFTPWKGNGLHPSAVVAKAEEWRGNDPVIIQPSWYKNTYAWHLDRELVRDPNLMDARLQERGIYPTDQLNDLLAQPGAYDTMVRVDAWAALTDPQGTVSDALNRAYPHMEPVEADRKVMVERYSR